MSGSLLRGNQLFASIIIAAVILMLIIPGIASGQDNNGQDSTPVIEVEITEEGNGFFQDIGVFFWVLIVLLILIIILIVFLLGRSRSGV